MNVTPRGEWSNCVRTAAHQRLMNSDTFRAGMTHSTSEVFLNIFFLF